MDLDVTLRAYTLATQTLIALHYLIDLADGMTIKDMKVRKTTLEGYMRAVSGYTLMPEVVGRDVRLEPEAYVDPSRWKTHPMITAIYHQTARWQGKVNRKDPLTYKMINWIREQGKDKHKHNFYTALAD